MSKSKSNSVRLNIYIHDNRLRRQIKAEALRRDISVSAYCLRAITTQLIKDQERSLERKQNPLNTALDKAIKFHTKVFGGKSFAVSSVDLIREAREERDIM